MRCSVIGEEVLEESPPAEIPKREALLAPISLRLVDERHVHQVGGHEGRQPPLRQQVGRGCEAESSERQGAHERAHRSRLQPALNWDAIEGRPCFLLRGI